MKLNQSDHNINKKERELGPAHPPTNLAYKQCTFELPSVFTIQGEEFNLKENKYYVNIASGATRGVQNSTQ